MNNVTIIGRLTKDPEVRYNSEQKAIGKFTVAVDRFGGKEKTADFISCVAFGKTAEMLDKYFYKGKQIALQGHIQTGSFQNKEGQTIYTTDVVAERIEFVGPKEERQEPKHDDIPSGFQAVDDLDDIPF